MHDPPDRCAHALLNLCYSDRVEGQGPFDFRERHELRCKARRAGAALAANARPNTKKPDHIRDPEWECGSDLLSRAVSSQVPSAC